MGPYVDILVLLVYIDTIYNIILFTQVKKKYVCVYVCAHDVHMYVFVNCNFAIVILLKWYNFPMIPHSFRCADWFKLVVGCLISITHTFLPLATSSSESMGAPCEELRPR